MTGCLPKSGGPLHSVISRPRLEGLFEVLSLHCPVLDESHSDLFRKVGRDGYPGLGRRPHSTVLEVGLGPLVESRMGQRVNGGRGGGRTTESPSVKDPSLKVGLRQPSRSRLSLS